MRHVRNHFNRSLTTMLALFALLAATASAQEPLPGILTLPSADDFATTVQRLEGAIADEGLTLLTTIDHAANAENVGLELLPTTVFLFGNPEAGTPLMQASSTFGLDLPQRMLVWENEDGDVFVTWRDPTILANEHGLPPDAGPLPNISTVLRALAETATGTP